MQTDELRRGLTLGFDLLGQPDLHQRLVGNISLMGLDLYLFKQMDRQSERNRLG